jgi:hypothetical protein
MHTFDLNKPVSTRLVGLYYRDKEVREKVAAHFETRNIGLATIMLEPENKYDTTAHQVYAIMNGIPETVGYVGKEHKNLFGLQMLDDVAVCAIINNMSLEPTKIDKYILVPVLMMKAGGSVQQELEALLPKYVDNKKAHFMLTKMIEEAV